MRVDQGQPGCEVATVAAGGRHCGDGKVCRFLCQLLSGRRSRLGCLAFVTDDNLYLLSVLVPLQMRCGAPSANCRRSDVLAWFKFERDRCLALAVVEMLLVGGDDLSGRDEVGIDEDVEVSGAFVNSRRKARPLDRWPPSLPRMVTQTDGAVGGLFEANRRGYGASIRRRR